MPLGVVQAIPGNSLMPDPVFLCKVFSKGYFSCKAVPAIDIYLRSDNESPVVTLTNCPVGLSTRIRSPRGSLSEI